VANSIIILCFRVKKFLGVNCGTNDAKVVTLSSSDAGGKRTYKCSCKDTPIKKKKEKKGKE